MHNCDIIHYCAIRCYNTSILKLILISTFFFVFLQYERLENIPEPSVVIEQGDSEMEGEDRVYTHITGSDITEPGPLLLFPEGIQYQKQVLFPPRPNKYNNFDRCRHHLIFDNKKVYLSSSVFKQADLDAWLLVSV